MSFILQFFHAPQVETLDAAVAYVDHGGDHEAPLGARFASFVARVCVQYPDGSADDEDGDDDGNVWPEGLDAAWGEEPVVNVAVKTESVDEALLSAVAASAGQAGLHVLDPQNAMLYRPDGVVVRRHAAADASKRLVPLAVRAEVGASLQARLAPHGFDLVSNNAFTLVSRLHGSIRQVIAITCAPTQGHVAGDVELWLSSEQLAEVWAPALAPEIDEWKARRDTECAGMAYDFVYGVSDLVPTVTAAESDRFGRFIARSRRDVDDFAGSLGDFVLDRLLPVLEPVRDLETLAALALTDDALDIVRRGRVRLPEQLGTAVLARLAKPSIFEDVVHGLQHNPNKAHYWRELGDARGELLARLVAQLRALPPAAH